MRGHVTSLNSFDKIGCKCKIFQSLPVYKTAPNLVCDSDSASSQSTLQHSTLCTHNNPHLRVSFYTLFIQIQSIFLQCINSSSRDLKLDVMCRIHQCIDKELLNLDGNFQQKRIFIITKYCKYLLLVQNLSRKIKHVDLSYGQ